MLVSRLPTEETVPRHVENFNHVEESLLQYYAVDIVCVCPVCGVAILMQAFPDAAKTFLAQCATTTYRGRQAIYVTCGEHDLNDVYRTIHPNKPVYLERRSARRGRD